MPTATRWTCSKLPQGIDLIAQVTVRNTSRRALDNLALTQMFPGGWEIRNDRLEGADTARRSQHRGRARAQRFWWVPAEWRDRQRRAAEYVDIRDDRVMRYFSLHPDEAIFFETRLNAAYLGPVLSTGRVASRRCTTPTSRRASEASGWKWCRQQK